MRFADGGMRPALTNPLTLTLFSASKSLAGGLDDDGTPRTKKSQKFIDFSRPVTPDTFAKATIPKSSRTKRKDPYRMTDANLKKQNTTSNLLPHDSGVGVAQLSRLFLRPNAAVRGVHSGGTGGAPKPAGEEGGGEQKGA